MGDSAELVESFKAYVKLAAGSKALTDAELCKMNSKAAGKMAKDTMAKGVSERVDSSVFPVFKKKGGQTMDLTEDNCEEFVKRCAHEQCKMTKASIPADDQKVKDKAAEIRATIINNAPKKNATAISKTGNVAGLTDTSKYTGSHVNRFDNEGKGKGREGRENLHENTGYVGQYKGKDTYAKKN